MSKLKTNFLMLAIAALSAFVPQVASASGLGSVGATVCQVYMCIMNNSMLLAIATVAILFLGIGAFFGKVNWGLVIIIVLGIVVIVGAMTIATSFVSGANSTNCGTGSQISASC